MSHNIYFHIDANCFFARCEEIINPYLETKPFVIATKHQYSIISCASKKARVYGIKAAMNTNEARNKCRDLIIIEPHYDLYESKSKQMFACIKRNYTDEIEIMSIDECYIRVNTILERFHDNYEILAKDIIKTIKKEVGLDVTIGIGDTKYLAKMAGDLKPLNRVATIFKNEINKKLWPMKIEKSFMVGNKTFEILKQLNIETIYDFLKYPNQNKLFSILKKRYIYLINAFTGIDSEMLDIQNKDKSISQSKTITPSTSNDIEIKTIIKWLCKELSLILNNRKIKTNHLTIYIKYQDEQKGVKKSFNMNIKKYTNDYQEILLASLSSFYKLWNKTPIRTIGVSANNLKNNDEIIEQSRLQEIN